MKKFKVILYWAARIVPAIILLQTLFFKFSASEESVYIFTKVGMEPWGRIGVGIVELVAAILLLINRTAWIGGGLAVGLMVGAIGMHLTILGIEVQGDGGYLFFLACVVTLSGGYVVIENKDKLMSTFKLAR